MKLETITASSGGTIEVSSQTLSSMGRRVYVQVTRSGGRASRSADVGLYPNEVEALIASLKTAAGIEDPVSDTNTILINAAIENDLTISFAYDRGKGLERRILQPESTIQSVKGDTLVVGLDTDRNDYRAYRVDRIQGNINVFGN
jgi:hypothetical protein